MSDDFPSSKFERGKIFAKTGLKLGTNYAKRHLKKAAGRKESKEESSRFHTENAREVFDEFSKLRGTALKIAQSLSMDQGMLPEEFTEVMGEAQYSVPPINKALARSIIKKQLGSYPEQVFSSFNTSALAAASIGQVHKARLKDGRDVAVKIQYPNVRETIQSDLGMAKILIKRFVKKGADLDDYFEEVESTLMEETDYIQEGQQIEAFRKRFSNGAVVTPEWIEELSTQKVLTMTFIEGKHLKEFLQTSPSQEERNHFGQLLWDFFHDQVVQRDTVHADTHPGNFLFTEDGRLGVIDFGCVKKFPLEFSNKYLRLLPIHMEDDIDKIRKLFIDLEITKENPDDPEKEERFFKFCMNYGRAFAQPYKNDRFDFGDPEFKALINRFAKEPPIMNEPRGSKHFIYSTRVHLGLYNLLMKLGAVVDTRESRKKALEVLEEIEEN
ncbi:AarF/ABC1/UbiB kinase family protein [Aliifodinibius sp. S!AR15-10]|uniref:ABC1 kinase family protein n=1 Tax=Aliifodinibius sp. S!AR15-10 TaxID=2950437 RepID=UPI00285F4AAC|nr:AarF/ABC1/UbiB kinase family protein [Aliifodinibius sp. S!AR15-10]MDR8392100.1 AarF/ABC1/UbiB kinase family protein [Aliifodinibius sp. S!AR15-10]